MGNAIRWSPQQLAEYDRRKLLQEMPRPAKLSPGDRVILAALAGEEATQKAPKPEMNKLEAAYEREKLAPWKRAGEILDYGYENVRFRIGWRTWYWPDFGITMPDGQLVLAECKGFMREDAWIKLKVFVQQYPYIPLNLVRRIKGQWQIARVGP